MTYDDRRGDDRNKRRSRERRSRERRSRERRSRRATTSIAKSDDDERQSRQATTITLIVRNDDDDNVNESTLQARQMPREQQVLRERTEKGVPARRRLRRGSHRHQLDDDDVTMIATIAIGTTMAAELDASNATTNKKATAWR